MSTNPSVLPSKLVRMPAGTIETYYVQPEEEYSFLKKLSVYAFRAGAKYDHDSWLCVRLKDHMVRLLVVVKIIKQGEQVKKRGRK